MTKTTEEQYLQQCLRLIEAQLGWGSGSDWNHYDFEKLSETIQDQTGVRLSVTTLKRIWGKLRYENTPTLTTLNVLAQFAGYADWRSFRRQETRPVGTATDSGPVSVGPEPLPAVAAPRVIPAAAGGPEPGRTGRAVKFRKAVWVISGLLLAGVGYLIIAFSRHPAPIDPARFSFRADKMVTRGVPNSVVFHYDARAARTDSVFIVQTWDIRRKTLVSKNNHAHSAIYYYPGFFRTKLLADGQVARTHDLQVTTDGWLGLIEEDPIPFYFKKADIVRNDRVEVDENLLKTYRYSLRPKAPKVRFFNQRDLGDLMNDNFVFETTLKVEYREGAGACQSVEVLIQCKDDIIIIPLAARTCVGELNLYFCGKGLNSREADLSRLGADLSQWTKLRVEAVDQHVTLHVNGLKACELTFPNPPTGIVGLQYRFNGLGAVKDTRFEHNGVVDRF
ncbi:hypothetical protein [Larkinella soli]|uniref:hypothetical protein n=1 Tax=Larkinella soli TaxID=1770527 RepID=UPI000FFB4BE6|nr:hypothetical protein [Larkinella soli]